VERENKVEKKRASYLPALLAKGNEDSFLLYVDFMNVAIATIQRSPPNVKL